MRPSTLITHQPDAKQSERRDTSEARSVYWSVYDEDDYTCADCGSPDGIEVHHIDGNPLNDAIENLIGLCHACHRARHMRAHTDWRLNEMRREFDEMTG